jgi:hypothetical protein
MGFEKASAMYDHLHVNPDVPRSPLGIQKDEGRAKWLLLSNNHSIMHCPTAAVAVHPSSWRCMCQVQTSLSESLLLFLVSKLTIFTV